MAYRTRFVFLACLRSSVVEGGKREGARARGGQKGEGLRPAALLVVAVCGGRLLAAIISRALNTPYATATCVFAVFLCC